MGAAQVECQYTLSIPLNKPCGGEHPEVKKLVLVWMWVYSESLRSRKAFMITETELKVIAVAAITGLSNIPKIG